MAIGYTPMRLTNAEILASYNKHMGEIELIFQYKLTGEYDEAVLLIDKMLH